MLAVARAFSQSAWISTGLPGARHGFVAGRSSRDGPGGSLSGLADEPTPAGLGRDLGGDVEVSQGASRAVTFLRLPAPMGMTFGTTARNRWLGPLQSWALLPLRLVVGYGFAAHGYAKLVRGPAAFAEILAAIGVPAPVPAAWVTSLLEFVGGISLMLGAAVVPLGLPLIVVMATAMFGVHARYGFSSVRLKSVSAAGAVFGPVGFELNLVYIAALLALGLGGPSPLSVDRWIESRRTVRQETPHGDARHRS